MDNTNAIGRKPLRPSTRRLIQLYSALLHNAHLKGFIDGEIYQGSAKYACAPGFNCYSCPGAVAACPLGALQNALASSGHRAGWYVMGILLLFGVTLGRTICGWLCPLGLIQELLNKIPTYKIKKSRITRVLTWLRYVILVVFVLAIPLWYGLAHDIPVPGFCKYICPAGTFEGAIGLLSNPANTSLFGMLGILFTRKFTIMLIIGLACIFCYRSFCRFICPLGAIYGLFNKFCLVGVRVDQSRCNSCGACVRNCGMDVRHVGDHECIHCAKCMDVCAQKAISLKAGNVVLMAQEEAGSFKADNAVKATAGAGSLKAGNAVKAPAVAGSIKAGNAVKSPAETLDGKAYESRKKAGRIAWGIALLVLCAALVWFNFLDPAVRAETGTGVSGQAGAGVSNQAGTGTEVSGQAGTGVDDTGQAGATIGFEPGMELADFTMECLDGSEFHLADTRGKVVFINLWATYCTPCVQELPHFDALYQQHEGDIAMLAVHSSIVTDDPAEFLADKGWTIPFAVDTEDDMLWSIVDGSSTLPQTIVLDRNGIVIYNQKGSVTPEVLAALYEQAAGE